MEVEEDLELENTDWIDEIKKENDLYKHFYKEVNESINVSFIYVNKNNDIYYVKNINFPLKEGVLKKEDLLFLLKKHNVYNSFKHQILSILQYNIDLEPSDLLSFLKSNRSIILCKHVPGIVPLGKSLKGLGRFKYFG